MTPERGTHHQSRGAPPTAGPTARHTRNDASNTRETHNAAMEHLFGRNTPDKYPRRFRNKANQLLVFIFHSWFGLMEFFQSGPAVNSSAGDH